MPADASPDAGAGARSCSDGRAVAFCYPVLQTETLWDVSVDTLEGFRGRGACRARGARDDAVHAGPDKAPVWGALETNAASLRWRGSSGSRKPGG